MFQGVVVFLLVVGKFDTSFITRKKTRDLVAASLLAPLTFMGPLDAHGVLVDNKTQSSEATTVQTVAETNYYLPRLLYPGTYKNYCGPTPEVTPGAGCQAHGWHGDSALDPVDNACRIHDVAYCHCQADLASRLLEKQSQSDNDNPGSSSSPPPMLSSLAALRFVTDPVLRAKGVDGEYFECVHKADQKLIATGIQIRGEQQRKGCDEDSLGWFCNTPDESSWWNTLTAFEKVNLNIFLKDLDADDKQKTQESGSTMTLTQMEKQRHINLVDGFEQGKDFPDAAFGAVQQVEKEMLQRITSDD